MTKMMSNLLTLLFTILLFDNTFAIGKSSFPKEYYISIEGSDEWDGTASENIPFTNTGPWLTIQNAITQLKNIRGYNPGPEDHVTVNIMSGTYYQESTVKLAIHDSYIDFVSTNDAIISAGYSANFTWNKQGNVLSTRVGILKIDYTKQSNLKFVYSKILIGNFLLYSAICHFLPYSLWEVVHMKLILEIIDCCQQEVQILIGLLIRISLWNHIISSMICLLKATLVIEKAIVIHNPVLTLTKLDLLQTPMMFPKTGHIWTKHML